MHSTCGIILKREDFRERDERITLYTKDFGKISVVAKGTKRIEAKLRGNLDIFNFVDIIFVEGKHFFILTAIDIRERFCTLTKDVFIYTAAMSAVNTVVHVFEENLPDRHAGAMDEEFFDSIYFFLNKLNKYESARSLKHKPAHGFERRADLYAWLLLKKFQMGILENQGYKVDENSFSALRIPKPSRNTMLFFDMLGGSGRKISRISAEELLGAEGVFEGMFSYLFGYRLNSWIPSLQ